MKVILLKNVPKVGNALDVKDVKPGYARNFLIPEGLVEIATDAAIAQIEERRAKAAVANEAALAEATEHIKALDGKSVTLSEKANEKGHLFAGIHHNEIVEAIKKQLSIDLLPEHILLEEPIKETGEHAVEIGNGNVKATLTLSVTKAE
ncbi:MAG: 50S ribosomal protein L9 [Parcubacteria group bacterium]|nr:50S ribosomal protein L9 [Parcubacteria group bacterium]